MKTAMKLSLKLQLQPLQLLLRSPHSTTVRFAPRYPLIRNKTSSFIARSCRAMASYTKQQIRVKEKIELSDTERHIFDRLIGTLRHFDLQTELRVAGGWVRDKLLGKECYDIDIALENMLGSEFVDKVKDYLSSLGEDTQGLAVIPCNPDQSKHLETARIRLCGLWIDFVNLRCEDYAENSRIPTMKFGTAKDDALRRDLTINSLFYNIKSGFVEDLTGRGIADLRDGKIVTPLPPKATFLDDPLRVLRAIRFGSRFGFILDKDLKEAAASEEVKTALGLKISRERVGVEIDLMMSGPDPVQAMRYISDLELFWVVFSIPPEQQPPVSEDCHRHCVLCLDAAWNLIQSIRLSTFNEEQRRLSFYAALFLPFRNSMYKANKTKKIPVINHIFRASLKRKISDADTVVNINNAVEKFLSLLPFFVSDDGDKLVEVDWASDFVDIPDSSKLRVLTGFVLREIKDFWRVALLLSTLLYPPDVDFTRGFSSEEIEIKKTVFHTVENAIVKLGLDEIWQVKPLINGKDIMTVLQLNSGGPLVREWQQRLLAWQLANPSGTAEECLDWMKQNHLKRAKTDVTS